MSLKRNNHVAAFVRGGIFCTGTGGWGFGKNAGAACRPDGRLLLILQKVKYFYKNCGFFCKIEYNNKVSF